MRSLEIPFSELKKYLEDRGEKFEDDEYIESVQWQMNWPEAIVFVSVDGPRIGLDQMKGGRKHLNTEHPNCPEIFRRYL